MCAQAGRSYNPLTLQDIFDFKGDRRTGAHLAPGQRERRKGVADRRASLRFVGLGVLFIGLAAPASAQIYSWKDANGNLVVSNRRQGSAEYEQKSFPVPQAEAIRATRYVLADRTEPFEDIIAEHSRTHGVRTELVKAVMQVESAFNQYARSPKGALGLMQLMPATAQRFGVKNPFDPTRERARGRRLPPAAARPLREQRAARAGRVQHQPPRGRQVRPEHAKVIGVAELRQADKPDDGGQRHDHAPGDNGGFKVTEVMDGRTIVRYTDKKPTTGTVDVVGAR